MQRLCFLCPAPYSNRETQVAHLAVMHRVAMYWIDVVVVTNTAEVLCTWHGKFT